MPTWDDLIKQRGANFKLIEELVEHGSNVEMLHECKHHFYSSDLSALQQLSEKAKIFRYSISKIGSEKKRQEISTVF
jgi:regulator of RNase E activity RraB